jgi:uncharacterized protein YdeI (YjbR/CyaY-like superfamily)
MEPTYFATPAEFQAWLEAHHERARELLVGYHKKGSGIPSMTWPESVDQALCFGWIDGVRRTVDEQRYTIRFTPRRARSAWSPVNLKRIEELKAVGLVRPAGIAAWEARGPDREGVYDKEARDTATLTPEQEARFRADEQAWAYFESRPAGYRRHAVHYVVRAKQEATRERRFEGLLAASRAGEPIAHLRPRRGKE